MSIIVAAKLLNISFIINYFNTKANLTNLVVPLRYFVKPINLIEEENLKNNFNIIVVIIFN